MKKLILARHGHYHRDEDGHLTEYGERQMAELGRRLGSCLGSAPRALILSSTAPRGLESARILGDVCAIRMEGHEVLWADNQHAGSFRNAFALVESKKDEVDALILVTHLDYVARFPSYFADSRGIKLTNGGYEEVPNGAARAIDCELNTVVRI